MTRQTKNKIILLTAIILQCMGESLKNIAITLSQFQEPKRRKKRSGDAKRKRKVKLGFQPAKKEEATS